MLCLLSRHRKILLKSYSREQGWQDTWRGRKSREKFFLVLKKWKIFLGHDVLQSVLNGQSSETQKQAVAFCSPELAQWMISLPSSVFLNFCYHLLLQVSLFLLLFSFSASCNLTSMLQFILLSFISPLGPGCTASPTCLGDSQCCHSCPHTYAHTLPALCGFHCAFVGVLLCQR